MGKRSKHRFKRRKELRLDQEARERAERMSQLPDTAYGLDDIEDFDEWVFGESLPVDVGTHHPPTTASSWKGKNTTGFEWKADPTDATWDLKAEERHRQWAIEDAEKDIALEGPKFRAALEAFVEAHPESIAGISDLLAAHADMTIAKVRLDLARREEDRVTFKGGIEPGETKRDFLDLGARLYRVLSLDHQASQSNLDLIAATLDAVSYIQAASWQAIEREMERDVKKAKKKAKKASALKGEAPREVK